MEEDKEQSKEWLVYNTTDNWGFISILAAHYGCPTNWKLHGSMCYFKTDRAFDWLGAQKYCRGLYAGADLVKIDSADVQGFVNSKILCCPLPMKYMDQQDLSAFGLIKYGPLYSHKST